SVPPGRPDSKSSMTGSAAASAGTTDANGEINTLINKLKITITENAGLLFFIVFLLVKFEFDYLDGLDELNLFLTTVPNRFFLICLRLLLCQKKFHILGCQWQPRQPFSLIFFNLCHILSSIVAMSI